MTLIDCAILLVIVLAILGGLSQGFLRSIFALAGLLGGLVLAAWNYGLIAPVLMPLVRVEQLANAIAFMLIALLVMGLAAIVGKVLSKTAHKIGLGCLDRLAGGVFGFFQGALLVTLLILVVVAFFPRAHWMAQARLPGSSSGFVI